MKVQNQIDELLTLRASEWFEILKNPTTADLESFLAWLSESRRHVDEFLAVAAIDEAVGDMPEELRENINELVQRVSPSITALPAKPRPLAGHATPAPSRSRKNFWSLAAAACVTVVVVGIVLFNTLGTQTRYTTDIGEQRTLELADTSIVTLNADSQIRWEVDETRRDVELPRGEAIFTVAHDANRPFRVHTRNAVVQAIGTKFNVYARPTGDTRVSVLEGRVQLTALTAAPGSAPQTLMLSAGEEADIQLNGSIAPNPEAAVENSVAWRERRLAFSNVLLEDMIVEFNRYNRSPRLRLENVPPGIYRFAGTFNATDPQSLADLLSREPDLSVERKDSEIVIRVR
ncbi:FecR family protein [Steroidobacter sp.]|uniref:FecR family protein n=1 Tax=Steroidobacter sp. TaxID=1978227 RepID=UPI001A4790FE|nr:FecR domain-containing protein [Steroidobacter sp.]MBL8266647.1 FecR domain-containing protein [Steroidobacter sp.]